MKKISTLYKKDPNDLGRVINEINPENQWVFTDEGVKATQKFDGTSCAIINGELYKRYDVKKGKAVPEGAVPCQEPDEVTGHWPHWIKCSSIKPEDKWHWEAFIRLMSDVTVAAVLSDNYFDGTYELCGEKVQGNPEGIDGHSLIEHGSTEACIKKSKWTFDGFKEWLTNVDMEGIVFHHPDVRMCKLRKSDYGIKR